MRTYNPDCWVLVELSNTNGETHRRVLAGWYGGFVGVNSWRLSSGITKTVFHDDYFEFQNESGSIYQCYKDVQKLSSLTADILKKLKEQNDSAEVIAIE